MCLRSIAFTLGVATVGLVGCNQAGSSTDSWYDRPADTSSFQRGMDFPPEDMFRVSQDHLTSAEAQLKDVACVGITLERAGDLIGFPVELRTGMSFVLVRAVAFNLDTGNFSGTQAGPLLWIHHSSLGGSAVSMKRQPLVLRVFEKPDKAFATCSMAE